jgi:hypothetical protein
LGFKASLPVAKADRDTLGWQQLKIKAALEVGGGWRASFSKIGDADGVGAGAEIEREATVLLEGVPQGDAGVKVLSCQRRIGSRMHSGIRDIGAAVRLLLPRQN